MKLPSRDIAVAVLLCMTQCLSLSAAQLNFRSVGTRDGLASMFVLTVHQDDEGFIWAGTYNGVSLLGGNNSQVLYPSRPEIASLAGSIVYHIQSTTDAKVWFQSNIGMHLWDRTRGVMEHHPEARGGNVCAISPHGDAVVFSSRSGLLYYNKVERTFLPLTSERLNYDECLLMSLDTLQHLTIFATNEKIVWQLATNDADGTVSAQLKERTPYPFGSIYYASTTDGRCFFIDNDHRVLMTDADGLDASYCFTLDETMHQRGFVSSIMLDHDDLLISFGMGGIIRMQRQSDGSYAEQTQLFDCGVFAMMKDRRQDILWVASDGEGLCYSVRTPHLVHNELSKDLPFTVSKPVRAFQRDSNGDLLVATKGDGLLCFSDYQPFDHPTSSVRQFTRQNSPLLDNSVYSFAPSSHGIIWIGTDASGINYYNPSSRQMGVLAVDDPTLANIHALLEVDGNDLYAASKFGFFRIRLTWNGSTPVAAKTEKLIYAPQRELTNFISISRKNHYLWLACRAKGLVRYDIKTGRYAVVRFSPEPQSTPNDIICVDASPADAVYCGTSAGGFELSEPTNGNKIAYTNLTDLDDLHERVIRLLMTTSADTLWAATPNSLYCVDTKARSYTIYTEANGMLMDEFNEGACFYDSISGNTFFGSANGFVVMSPVQQKAQDIKPPILFYAVHAGNEYFDTKALTEKRKPVVLHHNQNYFTVGFTAVDYIDADNYTFEYRLNDNPWIDNGHSRTISFVDMSPGRYKLQVRYNKGAYLSPAYTLQLRVLPPWWTSLPARIAYCLLGLFIVAQMVNRYIRRLRLRRQHEAEEVEKRHREELYNSRLRFFIDLTHQFSTPLMLIEGPIQRILEAKPLNANIQHYADLIQESSRKMNALIQRVIEFRSYETGRLLPLEATPEAQQKPLPPEPQKLDASKPIVFIADDNHEVLALLTDVLKAEFNVICFDATQNMIDRIATLHPNMVIAETTMPQLGGIELCRQLKADSSTAHIPVVLLSTDFNPQTRTDSATVGADSFLTKPFDLDYFLSVVRSLLQQRSQLKAYFNSALSAFELRDGRLLHEEDRAFMERIVATIEDNLENPDLSAAFIAEKMGVGLRNLYRRMQEITDETPKTLIHELRLENARRLLTKTGMTMEEVCYRSGYNNRGTFYRQFLAKFGCTPRQYHDQMMQAAHANDVENPDGKN